MKGFLFIVFISTGVALGNAQMMTKPLTFAESALNRGLPADTSVKKHSPKKATIMSAVVPGLGQFYNEKYWKIGVIYVGGGLLAWYFKRNTDSLNSYQKAYLKRIDTASATIDDRYYYLSDESVLANRNFRRRSRDFAILGFIGLYALQIIDANVDAHLREFDINKDLSMKISPQLMGLATPQRNFGLSVKLRF
jgi:hypothetical protein